MIITATDKSKNVDVGFDGTHADLIRELSAAMASTAETCGMLLCLSDTDGLKRDEAENNVMGQIVEAAYEQLHKRRALRQNQ